MSSANTYNFGMHRDLTPSALFFLIFLDEAQRQLGIEDIVALGGAIVGYPFLSTRGKFSGATKGTSVASIVSRKMLPYDIKYRILPTLTLKSAAQLKVIFTRNLGVFVGRAIPVVGEVVLVIDIFFITSNSVRNYNKIVKREDKIF
ncbi:MAG TPA: hypothetical protein VF616_04280 [Duganella sp.]|uniref:STM2901 family protein n=1 Tax=Duganella sp. TaxID=1904440 RepID=UPI002ED5263D